MVSVAKRQGIDALWGESVLHLVFEVRKIDKPPIWHVRFYRGVCLIVNVHRLVFKLWWGNATDRGINE